MVAALKMRKLNMFSNEKACFDREGWLGESRYSQGRGRE